MGDERDPGMETSRPPTHRQGAIWTERSLLALIIASLAVTFNLLLAIHRQALIPMGSLDSETKTPQTAPPTSLPKPVAQSQVTAGDSGGIKPAIAQRPPERPKDRPAPEDPTKKAVAGLTNATGQEIAEAERSDRSRYGVGNGAAGVRGGVAAVEAARAFGSPADRRPYRPRQSIGKRGGIARRRARRAGPRTGRPQGSAHQGKPSVRIRGLALQGTKWDLAAPHRPGMHGRQRQAAAARSRPSHRWIFHRWSILGRALLFAPSLASCSTSRQLTRRMEPPPFRTWFSWFVPAESVSITRPGLASSRWASRLVTS